MKKTIFIQLFFILSIILPARSTDPTYLTILGSPYTFSQQFNSMSKDSSRQLAFGVILYTMNTDVNTLNQQTEQALDLAESSGYPVLIKLDDWNYNTTSTDSELVEWTGWPANGHKYGPLVKRRWINWGTWFTVEAPRNYESSKLRLEIENKLVNGVIPPIVNRLAKWQSSGKQYLFAGLVVGWESGYYTMKGYGTINLNPLPTYNGITYSDSDEVNTGYAALTSKGYTLDSVKKIASLEGKTEDQVIHGLMSNVVQDYIAFWTKTCYENGIPQNRIYTHFTAVATIPESQSPISFSDGRVLPIESATNQYSRPGVTATDYLINIDTTSKIFNNLQYSEWGASEIDFSNSTRTEQGAAQLFDHLSEAGAKMMCLFGWWITAGDQFEVKTPGVIEAISNWLNGTANSELPIAVSSSNAASWVNVQNVLNNNPSDWWASAGHNTPNGEEWICIDQRTFKSVAKVVLVPRQDGDSVMCFPQDFKIQYSSDAFNWTDVPGQSYTNYPSPQNQDGEVFTFSSPVRCRFIRIYATKLRPDYPFIAYWLCLAEFKLYSSAAGVNDKKDEVAASYSLLQNYPNPFNPATIIKYGIPQSGLVTLKVYNVLGQEVACLVNKEQKAGTYNVTFDAAKLASGVYMYKIQSGNYSLIKKMMLLK
ncbi:MAG: discoidin domain-containing protein [Ignavibacteriaceae bacterium]|nr:discoidin domain-containing protein [Ignavibacteriaceae bacterium]